MNEMPKCDFCGKPAITFLQRRRSDGESETISICAECMHKKGMDFAEPETILTAFDNMHAGISDEDLEAKCACGSTGGMVANGLAGCENCYVRFRNLLDAVFAIDDGDPATPIPMDDFERLKMELADAVEDEDYEKAAAIRDQMAALEETKDVDETKA